MFVSKFLTFYFKSFLSLNAFLLHFSLYYQTFIESHSSVHLSLLPIPYPSSSACL